MKKTYVATIKGDSTYEDILRDILGDEFELVSLVEGEETPEEKVDYSAWAKEQVMSLLQEELSEESFESPEHKEAFGDACKEVERLFDITVQEEVTLETTDNGCANPKCTAAVLNEIVHEEKTYCSFDCVRAHKHSK